MIATRNNFLKKTLMITSAVILLAVIYLYKKTNLYCAQDPIWNQATEIIQTRLQTILPFTHPVTLVAALAIAFHNDPNDTATFDLLIKQWIKQGANINQIFTSGEAYLLFFEQETYDQVENDLKQQSTTVLVAFAGLSTLVATLLKNNAKLIVKDANALDAWAIQYIQLKQQEQSEIMHNNEQSNLNRMLLDSLQFLLKAATQSQKNDFFKKYPEFETMLYAKTS